MIANQNLNQIVYRLDIEYKWTGSTVSPVELQETYVADGFASIHDGLILPNNYFVGISIDSRKNERRKSLMRGKFDLNKGILLLRKDYIINNGDVSSYLYKAKRLEDGSYSGMIYGATSENSKTDFLKKGFGTYGEVTLKMIKMEQVK